MDEATQIIDRSRYLDRQMLPRALDLLAIAQTDRHAADALHREELFPQAVFSLQQTVEKTIKAIGLVTRVVAVGELQSAISHKAVNVYVLGLRKFVSFASVHVADQKLITQLSAALRTSESDRDRFISVAKPTASEIQEWINFYRFFGAHLRLIIGGPEGEKIAAILAAAGEKDQFYTALSAKQLMEAFATLFGLYFLSLATLAHAVASRYGDGVTSPLDIYTQTHPLVVHFSTLLEVAGECLNSVQSTFGFIQQQ